MRKLLLIVAALILVPIAEIAVLVAVGHVIGLWPTLLLMLATSVLGGWLLKREGPRAWRAVQDDLVNQRPPGHHAVEGLLVVIGGIFMLVPGFLSDLIGLFFLAPPTRKAARALVQSVLAGRLSPRVTTMLFGARRVKVHTGTPTWTPPPARGGTVTLDGEIMR